MCIYACKMYKMYDEDVQDVYETIGIAILL